MPTDKHPEWAARFYDQQEINKQLERGAVCVTLKTQDSIELSNGVTIVFKESRSTRSARIVVIAPRDVLICREGNF